MKYPCQLVACLCGVLAACQQGPRDATLDRDSGSIAPDTAKQNQLGRSFEQKWIPGQPDGGEYENTSRFSARAYYFSNAPLQLWLDTSTHRARQKTPRSSFAPADSLAISDLETGEFFTQYCRVDAGLADGQIGGLARTLVPEQWERPRLAWVFDTVTSRIRSIPADSVSCAVPEPD